MNEYLSFSRSYTKLLDIVGNIYGMGEIVVFFLIFIYGYYNKLALNSYLCNRLLYLEEDESENSYGIRKSLSKMDKFHSRKIIFEYFTSKNNTNKEKKFNRNKKTPFSNLQSIKIASSLYDDSQLEIRNLSYIQLLIFIMILSCRIRNLLLIQLRICLMTLI